MAASKAIQETAEKPRSDYTFKDHVVAYSGMRQNRRDFDAEYKEIVEYIAPGKGMFDETKPPQHRKFSSKKVINPIARDAGNILASELHSRLTSPSRAWFALAWEDQRLRDSHMHTVWIENSQKLMLAEYAESNFYQAMLSFYRELMDFGTAVIFSGEGKDDTLFYFETLTAGEYVFSINRSGMVDCLYRLLFLTPKMIVDTFGEDNVSEYVRRNKSSSVEYVMVLEYMGYEDGKVKQKYFEYGTPGASNHFSRYDDGETDKRKPLKVSNFKEFPYHVAWWRKSSTDLYGVGLGSRALPLVKRLQEMEKSFLMATHKMADPPLAAPFRMKGKIDRLPGGISYKGGPNESVDNLYSTRFDYNGVAMGIQRVEQAIQRTYYNDLFFTAYRDPNATPYKATEVSAREREKMTRLGPVVEGLGHYVFTPMINRNFNMMVRRNKIVGIDDQENSIKVDIVSPMAQAQKMIAIESIQNFYMFAGHLAQFDQSALDNLNVDESIRDIAEITGVSNNVLKDPNEVQAIRQQRAQQQQQQMMMQQEMMQLEAQNTQAETAEKRARAAERVSGITQEVGYGPS